MECSAWSVVHSVTDLFDQNIMSDSWRECSVCLASFHSLPLDLHRR
jgi:hypothetical protein